MILNFKNFVIIITLSFYTFQLNNNLTKMSECIICGAIISLNDSTIVGEVIECTECGTELEVKSLNPAVLQEAPSEKEDWGE